MERLWYLVSAYQCPLDRVALVVKDAPGEQGSPGWWCLRCGQDLSDYVLAQMPHTRMGLTAVQRGRRKGWSVVNGATEDRTFSRGVPIGQGQGTNGSQPAGTPHGPEAWPKAARIQLDRLIGRIGEVAGLVDEAQRTRAALLAYGETDLPEIPFAGTKGLRLTGIIVPSGAPARDTTTSRPSPGRPPTYPTCEACGHRFENRQEKRITATGARCRWECRANTASEDEARAEV